MEEIRTCIGNTKRRTAPGPDGIPVEALNEITQEALEGAQRILNHWWLDDSIPDEASLARVVLACQKKGDSSRCDNYPVNIAGHDNKGKDRQGTGPAAARDKVRVQEGQKHCRGATLHEKGSEGGGGDREDSSAPSVGLGKGV